MGFMDKAKKIAEQAQEKLDEVQTKFNESQQAKAGGAEADAPVEDDAHGRATGAGASAPTAPAGTPEAPVAPVEPAAPAAAEARPPKSPSGPVEDPEAPGAGPDDAPPKMSQGDPLAG
jgi:hypothetical protein